MTIIMNGHTVLTNNTAAASDLLAWIAQLHAEHVRQGRPVSEGPLS